MTIMTIVLDWDDYSVWLDDYSLTRWLCLWLYDYSPWLDDYSPWLDDYSPWLDDCSPCMTIMTIVHDWDDYSPWLDDYNPWLDDYNDYSPWLRWL